MEGKELGDSSHFAPGYKVLKVHNLEFPISQAHSHTHRNKCVILLFGLENESVIYNRNATEKINMFLVNILCLAQEFNHL
jgi:hypothetical protein